MNTQLNKIEYLINKPQVDQRSTEWYESRHKILTASEIASALEANPFQTKYDLLYSKLRQYTHLK